MPRHDMTFDTRAARERIKRMVALLRKEPMTAQQIADALHCHKATANLYLQHLRTNPRRVRVSAYTLIGNKYIPVYAIGKEPDARRQKMTHREKWAKLKSRPEQYEKTMVRRRAYHHAKRDELGLPRRPMKKYPKPLVKMILELLEQSPGYTVSKMAARFGTGKKAVGIALTRLHKAGKIQRAKASTLKEFEWELPHKPMPEPVAKVLGIQPQSWMSALFLEAA